MAYCSNCYEKIEGFEPDMGDGINFYEGNCDNCGDEIVVFEA